MTLACLSRFLSARTVCAWIFNGNDLRSSYFCQLLRMKPSAALWTLLRRDCLNVEFVEFIVLTLQNSYIEIMEAERCSQEEAMMEGFCVPSIQNWLHNTLPDHIRNQSCLYSLPPGWLANLICPCSISILIPDHFFPMWLIKAFLHIASKTATLPDWVEAKGTFSDSPQGSHRDGFLHFHFPRNKTKLAYSLRTLRQPEPHKNLWKGQIDSGGLPKEQFDATPCLHYPGHCSISIKAFHSPPLSPQF